MFLQIAGYDFRGKKLPEGVKVHAKDFSALEMDDDSLLATAGLWLPEVRDEGDGGTYRVSVCLENLGQVDWTSTVDLGGWYFQLQPEVLVQLRGVVLMTNVGTAEDVAGRFQASRQGECVIFDSEDHHYYSLGALITLITNYRALYGDLYVYGNAEGLAEDTLLLRIKIRSMFTMYDYYPFVEQTLREKVSLDPRPIRNRYKKSLNHAMFVARVLARSDKWAGIPFDSYSRPSGKTEPFAGGLLQNQTFVDKPLEGRTLVYGKNVQVRKKNKQKSTEPFGGFTKKYKANKYAAALYGNATTTTATTTAFQTRRRGP